MATLAVLTVQYSAEIKEGPGMIVLGTLNSILEPFKTKEPGTDPASLKDAFNRFDGLLVSLQQWATKNEEKGDHPESRALLSAVWALLRTAQRCVTKPGRWVLVPAESPITPRGGYAGLSLLAQEEGPPEDPFATDQAQGESAEEVVLSLVGTLQMIGRWSPRCAFLATALRRLVPAHEMGEPGEWHQRLEPKVSDLHRDLAAKVLDSIQLLEEARDQVEIIQAGAEGNLPGRLAEIRSKLTKLGVVLCGMSGRLTGAESAATTVHHAEALSTLLRLSTPSEELAAVRHQTITRALDAVHNIRGEVRP